MYPELATRRRVLILTYTRYLKADQAWASALRDMKSWFPANTRPGPSAIGNPGSPIRRLYERRARALLQLEVARQKLEAARQRATARRRTIHASVLLLASYPRS
mgnify:CR=1 FL=1